MGRALHDTAWHIMTFDFQVICLRIQLRRTFITGHLGSLGSTPRREFQTPSCSDFDDFSVSDKHLVPHDFMDEALKPVSFTAFLAFVSQSEHGTPPLSLDDLCFNVNDLLLETNTKQERLSQCYHIPSSIARGSTMKLSHHCPHVALASSSWGRNIGGQAAATSL